MVCVHVDSVLVSGIKLRQVYSASGICFEVSGLFAGIFLDKWSVCLVFTPGR